MQSPSGRVPHTSLMLDSESVAGSDGGVQFHLNSAVKHPENPVLLPGEPHHWDSLAACWPGTVLYSPRERRFRCWYTGMDVVQGPDRAWHTGYAESTDGIHWDKPALGQAKFLDCDTNLLKPDWKPSFLSTVFENPLPDATEARRFGGLWIETRQNEEKKSLWSKSLAWSPDGITWTRAGVAYTERLRAPLLDISQMLYDPSDPDPSMRWKAYGQYFVPRPDGSGWPGIRNIGLAHGADPSRVEDYQKNVVIFSPQEGIDEEIHFAAVQKIGATYLMLFESDRFSKNPIHGDLRLAVSTDGVKWRRVHEKSALVATGRKGMWDENLLVTSTAGWQEVGDEIWIYYFGCPSTYNSWPAQYAVSSERRGSWFAPAYMGLATLPRDRFAYASGPGTLTTHLIEIGADGGVWLNADGDDLSVAAIDSSGQTIAAGSVGHDRRQTVYRNVAWKSGKSPRGRCQLRITLAESSALYSIQS